jgi:Rab-GTPase-TBC domain
VGGGGVSAGVYERLMLCKGSDKELEIVRDLSRTYPSHVYYQQRQGPGQRSLFNVLRAYAIYDRQARLPWGPSGPRGLPTLSGVLSRRWGGGRGRERGGEGACW